MSKKKTVIVVILAVIGICLLGFLAFLFGNKIGNQNHKSSELKTESRTSQAQKKVINHPQVDNCLTNKLNNNDYYILARLRKLI